MEPQTIQAQPVNNLPPVNNIPASQFNSTLNVGSSHKKTGPIVAVIIVVLLIVLATLYILASKPEAEVNSIIPNNNTVQNTEDNIPNNAAGSANANATQTAEETIAPLKNTTDELQSLQNDLDQSIQGIDAQAI